MKKLPLFFTNSNAKKDRKPPETKPELLLFSCQVFSGRSPEFQVGKNGGFSQTTDVYLLPRFGPTLDLKVQLDRTLEVPLTSHLGLSLGPCGDLGFQRGQLKLPFMQQKNGTFKGKVEKESESEGNLWGKERGNKEDEGETK